MNFLALHGFTQRGSMWAEVAALVGGEWLAPDLPGHGSEPACGWNRAVAGIEARLAGLAAPRHLVGYSMGGRLALAAALAYPDGVDRLVLVSATPGLPSAAERRRRRTRDRVLAGHIEEAGMAAFAEEWLAHPLFAGLRRRPPEWRAADVAGRAANRAEAVAAALRRLGQGEQPYLGRRLDGLRMPVLLIAGAEDAAYVAEAHGMAGQIGPRATVVEVAGAGHSVVGERPEEVAAALVSWLAG
jgi:2-succinyl-6-hydroxy-2,4-cyclohexadiene-1-carboxylate synthase